MNKELTRPMGDKGVMEAFDQMDPRKAPDSDGLSGLFFYRELGGCEAGCFALL